MVALIWNSPNASKVRDSQYCLENMGTFDNTTDFPMDWSMTFMH